ncbi:MAG: gamma-glutamylcyclotransferase [Algicola sp.]|nr:gamma-glutamylcyclotransferase [Algicola sp.]
MYYFAYGSNMSQQRIQSRCPSARSMGMFHLKGHLLSFNKAGKDGSGKGNVVATNNEQAVVYGVVFDIIDSEITDLDQAEGLGIDYSKHTVSVIGQNNNTIDALIYIALLTDDNLKPYHWYKTHLLTGALEANLPHQYIQTIRNTESIADPNKQRTNHELAIYR